MLGDNMKKLPILFAFLASISCSYVLFSANKGDNNFQSNAIAIEIGAFKNLDYAKRMQERLGGHIIQDKDIYRIYYGVFSNDANILFIKNYLTNTNINYYEKNIMLNDLILDELTKYEIDIQNEKEEKNKINLVYKFLKKYEEVI